MKLGVSAYSFNQYIKANKMTQFDTISKAKEIGFDCIEFITLEPHDGSTKLEYAEKLRKEAKKVGIEINCYAVGANLAQENEEALNAEVAKVKDELDVAYVLGVKLFRNDATFNLNTFKSFDLALPTIVRGLREISDYGEKLGIKTTVENHGYICQDSDRLERLYNAVNHANFGLLLDMGNFTCVDEKPELAVSRLADYAFHVHAKDMIIKNFYEAENAEGCITTRASNKLRCTIVGNGNVPVKQCIAILKNRGYAGDLSLEFEGVEDCIYGITAGYNNLRTYLKELDLA